MEYTDMERRILDMWPKFEDGNYVQLGDKAVANSGENAGKEFIVRNIYFEGAHGKLRSSALDGCYWNWKSADTRVKRPAPKVLDADGVEIKVGDTVWHHSGFAHGVVTSIDASSLISTVRYSNGYAEFRDAAKDLTHVQPDSWERLEEDAEKGNCEYLGRSQSSCDGCYLNGKSACDEYVRIDLIRRAKALAEKEAAR